MTQTFLPPTPDEIVTLIARIGGPDAVQQVLSGALTVQLTPAHETAATAGSVPADLPFEERVARGRYGWRHEDLTEGRFPVTAEQQGDFEQQMFHFNRNVSSEDAARLIREAGYEPARIGEILVYGETCPHTQSLHPVVGLGSIAEVDGKTSAPTLWFDGERRTLDLLWLDGDWHRNYRFLGVRRPAT